MGPLFKQESYLQQRKLVYGNQIIIFCTLQFLTNTLEGKLLTYIYIYIVF